jgi:hypothetical protein
MRKIQISSVLPVSFRDELERIVFFNPEQSLIAVPLIASIQRYGMPAIVEEEEKLRFSVSGVGRVQSLYALDETEPPARLVGAVMYTREEPSDLLVLHLAVHQDYTLRGRWGSANVLANLVAALRHIALHTRGVLSLHFLYPREARFELRRPQPNRAVAKRKRKRSASKH